MSSVDPVPHLREANGGVASTLPGLSGLLGSFNLCIFSFMTTALGFDLSMGPRLPFYSDIYSIWLFIETSNFGLGPLRLVLTD